ncbi:hypothetical protein BDQ17DRAFT_1332925 [Cyathus striatus]|nr:hypothetical protein BDQ17DRAFT_1332925 [Cyathus striatus]
MPEPKHELDEPWKLEEIYKATMHLLPPNNGTMGGGVQMFGLPVQPIQYSKYEGYSQISNPYRQLTAITMAPGQHYQQQPIPTHINNSFWVKEYEKKGLCQIGKGNMVLLPEGIRLNSKILDRSNLKERLNNWNQIHTKNIANVRVVTLGQVSSNIVEAEPIESVDQFSWTTPDMPTAMITEVKVEEEDNNHSLTQQDIN